MNAKTLQKMDCFLGKVCTIISSSNTELSQKIEYSVVRIQEINSEGIWGTRPYENDMFSFFFLAHIISIHVEKELDRNKPEDVEIIKKYEILNESPSAAPSSEDSLFVDIEAIEKLAAQTKKIFDVHPEF